jgi:undecaprenyl diphosphate synthase
MAAIRGREPSVELVRERPASPALALPGRRRSGRPAPACGHHHGRQRPLGEGAGSAADAGTPRGGHALKRTVQGAADLGLQWLTVFGFSTENWRRPPAEVRELMRLLKVYVDSDLARLEREGVRVHVIGRREGLSPDVLEVIERAERRTAHNDAFHLQVAFNYGGRADIVDAARALVQEAAEGRLDPDALTDAMFERRLSTANGPTGPDRPHQRRAAALQLPPLGGGLRRVRVPGRAVARLRAGAPCSRDRRVHHARAALRRRGGR